ncbi:MAG TPA: MFS transporter [Terracidiphilus sp.]|nr:MFS transporter [Terracidiphilus sp.]
MSAAGATIRPREPWVPSFISGFAGWTFDGFDFFLVVFSLTAIGQTFGKSDKTVSLALTATLAFRPIGAFLFGLFADRYGRRLPIAINFALFAVVEVITGLAHTFTQFLVIRAIFGIVMGGQWGIGVTLAMEQVPARLRGTMSGVLQEGYAIGYLLAAAAFYLFFDHFSWRPLFFIGPLPAVFFAFFVLLNVRESAVWQRARSANWQALGRSLIAHWRLFVYFVVLMMALHMSSHGTQDIYPTFLQRVWHMSPRERAWVSSLAMAAGILGALSVGYISDRIGRRAAMTASLLGCVCSIPLWAFSRTIGALIAGAMLMQFFLQGAWGVVPAHLAEMSPDSIRGSLPGLGNQCGVLLASGIVYIELALAHGTHYAGAMAETTLVVFLLACVLVLLGRERQAVNFG